MQLSVLLVTQTVDASWFIGFFDRDGMGWPLLFVVGTAYAAHRTAKWLAPLVEMLVTALVAFVRSLEERLDRVERDGHVISTDLKAVIDKLDKVLEKHQS